MLRVESFDVSREFRRSEVLAFIGSFDASQRHCNSVTVDAVYIIPDVSGMYGNGYKTTSFSKGAINTPKPPPLEAADSAEIDTCFLALPTLLNPLLVSV